MGNSPSKVKSVSRGRYPSVRHMVARIMAMPGGAFLAILAMGLLVGQGSCHERKSLGREPAPGLSPVVKTLAQGGAGGDGGGGQPGEIRINPRDGAQMVWVPAGEFPMGSSVAEMTAAMQRDPQAKAEAWADEQPQRPVYLDGFWIYKNKVTVGQYRKFCRMTGRRMIEMPDWNRGDDYPMIYVTWQDAADYARWAGVTLPTEAQWEKAARGTEGRVYPWGNQWPPPAGAGNFADETLKANQAESNCLAGYRDGYEKTSPAGQFPAGASPYGCLDMVGNVFEFCADWYDPEYYRSGPDRNPLGPPSSPDREFKGCRVYRGSSWGSGPDSLRTTSRQGYSHLQPQTYIGFRCVQRLDRMSGQTFIFNQSCLDVVCGAVPGQAREWVLDWYRRVFAAGVRVFVADIARPDLVVTRDTPTGEIMGARFGVEYEDKIAGEGSDQGPANRIVYYRRIAELMAQDTDVLHLACAEGAKVNGIVLAGIRMNDAHQGRSWQPTSEAANMSLFMMNHPQWCNTWEDGSRDTTMNYAIPEVQAHRLQILREIATNYDIDGLELDWIRWPRHFPAGTQREHLKDLTHFVTQVRAMLDEVARKKGVERLVLGHRVPVTVAECLNIGCDVGVWVRQGLADFLSPMDFLMNDVNQPTEEFVALCAGTPCRVYPAFASMSYSFGRPDQNCRKAVMRTLDQFRATAANWYAWGATGGSSFNMYLSEPRTQAFYSQAVQIMSDPRAAWAGPRHYVYLPTWKDYRAGVDLKSRNPLPLDPDVPLRKDYTGGIGPAGRFNAQSLKFTAETIGKRQEFKFRMADGKNGEQLTGVMRVRIYSATPAEGFTLDLNGKTIPADKWVITHRPQGEVGDHAAEVLPDKGTFDWPPHLRLEIPLGECPPFQGDNILGITQVRKDPAGAAVVVMEALEVLVD